MLALAVATVAWAGRVTVPFAVRVNLYPAGYCATSPESPVQSSPVVIECRAKPLEPVATPKPRSDGQAFRFHLPSANGPSQYGAVDVYAGAGTITSWRVVHLAGWEYVEMTVGW